MAWFSTVGEGRPERDNYTGILAPLWRAYDGFRLMILDQFELFTIELQEEKARLMSFAIFGAATVVLGFMALIAITFAVTVAFWDNALAVLLGFCAFYIVAAIGFAFMLKSRIKAPAFPDTLANLKKDKEMLRRKL
jgi:uncharacterized membrane protein YqjE